MTHSPEALRDWGHSAASLRAALEELADLPVDVTASRMIAMAVGILSERFKIAPEEAFDLIVAVSRQEHVGVCDMGFTLTAGGDPESLWSAPASGVASVR